ncbi:hypothetical protein MTR67_014194 [Solanum verrucosum]|uniref:Uncharacterized protein n=1 Tax=Solanum verrucosum TaxID=315347 RepID=A0AAF0QJ13_SOLVR|nr:hypothetical protein MTR67_014194 [Solanum verrucosum]
MVATAMHCLRFTFDSDDSIDLQVCPVLCSGVAVFVTEDVFHQSVTCSSPASLFFHLLHISFLRNSD